jgi:hypothetical protein
VTTLAGKPWLTGPGTWRHALPVELRRETFTPKPLPDGLNPSHATYGTSPIAFRLG